MSLLEMVGSILSELEEVQKKLDRLLASGSEKDLVSLKENILVPDLHRGPPNSKLPETIYHSPGFDDYKQEPKKENTTTEAVEQDLAGVLLIKETEKAFLIVKHGFQVWMAKSHLESSEGFDLGNTYDLKVKDKSKWILKKLEWKPFAVVKS